MRRAIEPQPVIPCPSTHRVVVRTHPFAPSSVVGTTCPPQGEERLAWVALDKFDNEIGVEELDWMQRPTDMPEAHIEFDVESGLWVWSSHDAVIDYVNWKGKRSSRHILPKRVWFGSTQWHTEAGWLLDAYDVDKQAHRTFAMSGIKGWRNGGR